MYQVILSVDGGDEVVVGRCRCMQFCWMRRAGNVLERTVSRWVWGRCTQGETGRLAPHRPALVESQGERGVRHELV